MQRMAAQDEHPSLRDACIDCIHRGLYALGRVAFTGFSLAEDLAAGTGSQTRMNQNPESSWSLGQGFRVALFATRVEKWEMRNAKCEMYLRMET